MKERVADGICVLGLRFTDDMAVPVERFETLRRELGDGFIGVEIDSSEGNEWGIGKRPTPCSPATSSTSPATPPARPSTRSSSSSAPASSSPPSADLAADRLPV